TQPRVTFVRSTSGIGWQRLHSIRASMNLVLVMVTSDATKRKLPHTVLGVSRRGHPPVLGGFAACDCCPAHCAASSVAGTRPSSAASPRPGALPRHAR